MKQLSDVVKEMLSTFRLKFFNGNVAQVVQEFLSIILEANFIAEGGMSAKIITPAFLQLRPAYGMERF